MSLQDDIGDIRATLTENAKTLGRIEGMFQGLNGRLDRQEERCKTEMTETFTRLGIIEKAEARSAGRREAQNCGRSELRRSVARLLDRAAPILPWVLVVLTMGFAAWLKFTPPPAPISPAAQVQQHQEATTQMGP